MLRAYHHRPVHARLYLLMLLEFLNTFLYLGFMILVLTVATLFVPITRPAYAEAAA